MTENQNKSTNSSSNSQASSSSNSIDEPKCPTGFTGLGCLDKCGYRAANQNLKIVGGQVAIPHSWPSMALIIFKYKFNYTISNVRYVFTISSMCGGSLISRNVVLSAAHCYNTRTTFDYNGNRYPVNVVTNAYHPTIGSMYTVYLGIQNFTQSTVSPVVSPAVKVNVTEFIIVIF